MVWGLGKIGIDSVIVFVLTQFHSLSNHFLLST